jgi:hypothetical protein
MGNGPGGDIFQGRKVLGTIAFQENNLAKFPDRNNAIDIGIAIETKIPVKFGFR